MNNREIMMKHYEHPKNRKIKNEEGYQKVNTNNVSCIDNIDLYVKIENNLISDITFEGEACAISISSTSIMIENLIGKSLEEAKYFMEQFELLMEGKEYNKEVLKEALVYEDVARKGNRKTCALLPYMGIKKIIK